MYVFCELELVENYSHSIAADLNIKPASQDDYFNVDWFKGSELSQQEKY